MRTVSTLDGNDRLPIYPLRLHRVKKGTSWHVWFLQSHIPGCLTRYTPTGSLYIPPEQHGIKVPGKPLVWKGYVSALIWQPQPLKRWLPAILEVTERLELDLRGRMQRGQVWELTRALPTKKGERPPVRGAFLEQRPEETTPPALDAVPLLCHTIFRVEEIDLTFKNPLPDLVSVKPVDAPGPGAQTEQRPDTAERPRLSFTDHFQGRSANGKPQGSTSDNGH